MKKAKQELQKLAQEQFGDDVIIVGVPLRGWYIQFKEMPDAVFLGDYQQATTKLKNCQL